MIERHGSGIRAGRFFAFESPLFGGGNTASARGGFPDPDALGAAASRAGDAIVLVRPAPAREVDWRKLRVAGVALLATIGLWALAAAGSAWMERDALREWIEGPGGTPMPSVPPFDSPDSVARPPPAAPPPIDR